MANFQKLTILIQRCSSQGKDPSQGKAFIEFRNKPVLGNFAHVKSWTMSGGPRAPSIYM